MIPFSYASPEHIDWEDIRVTAKPVVTSVEASDARGPLYLIRDAALEPIDSTRQPDRVKGLVEYWQEALYGAGRKR